MSSGRLATVFGTSVMALVCVAVIVVALLGFTWLIDRASEIFEQEAANPTSSSPTARPWSWAARGFVSDESQLAQLPGAPSRLGHY